MRSRRTDQRQVEPLDIDTSVDIAPRHPNGFRLSNPVMTASGTFGYGTEFVDFFDIQRLGAIVCKGTTLRSREGNPQVRAAETPSGMLNTIGLQNVGVKALIEEKAPVWAGWRVPVVVNICGETLEEYVAIAEALDGAPGVAALELNISCPNVSEGGMEFGCNPANAARLTAAVKKAAPGLPLLVKITPNYVDPVEQSLAVEEAGADAICAINTIVGMAIDAEGRRPLLSTRTGGLSGPAIKPVALAMVYKVSQAVKAPVVGIGGIETGQDAIEFLMAGATAVQVGTANFYSPRASLEVLEGLTRWMRDHGVKRVSDLVGAAHPR
ncbi:MAG: dihydroorotate dehydrogenase [Chloroflexi bacterium]|nr:dihydroorotate dehydrogenase [Chloroflexota bacterium]